MQTRTKPNRGPAFSPGRAAKRKKTKIAGTYLLQGPLGRSKPDLPTYCMGSNRGGQTPYLARSRNPALLVATTCLPFSDWVVTKFEPHARREALRPMRYGAVKPIAWGC